MNGSTTTTATSDTSSTTSLSSEMDQDMMEVVTQENDDEEVWLEAENHLQADSIPSSNTTATLLSSVTTMTNNNNTTANTTTNTNTTSNSQGDENNEPHIPSDAETQLRKKILEIQRDTNLSAKEKARLIQQLMWGGNRSSSPKSDTSSNNSEPVVTEGEHISYHDQENGIMGCQHYQRKCKLQANCCGKIFSCRFCHDEVMSPDHNIIRTETKNMYCMLCRTIQPAGQHCQGCKQEMARYYCDKCKLWDDDPEKSIYHCDDCGMCRKGLGLGKDFFHCKKCNICMAISMLDKHRCIERNLESDCPICGEYMFTSTSTVIFMPCGHCIHKHCYAEYVQTSYQCPTCLKSLANMSEYFARLDRELERQTMPAEYDKYISHVFCNDCERRSPAKYHFFYHKCGHCKSYNTTVLRTENTEETNGSSNNNNNNSNNINNNNNDSNGNDNSDNNNESNGNNHLDADSLSSSDNDFELQQSETNDSPSSSNTTSSSNTL
ncbi:unnamed protein product [Cunninghamella blakesleeana]